MLNIYSNFKNVWHKQYALELNALILDQMWLHCTENVTAFTSVNLSPECMKEDSSSVCTLATLMSPVEGEDSRIGEREEDREGESGERIGEDGQGSVGGKSW